MTTEPVKFLFRLRIRPFGWTRGEWSVGEVSCAGVPAYSFLTPDSDRAKVFDLQKESDLTTFLEVCRVAVQSGATLDIFPDAVPMQPWSSDDDPWREVP